MERLVELLEGQFVKCRDLEPSFVPWLSSFYKQYADLCPQIADASLVFTADCLNTDVIFTLDRRDFVVLRTKQGRPFRLVPESL